MYKFFINHKLDISDICHLSDSDSEFAINELRIKVEDILKIETYEAVYIGVVTYIEKNSVEVEIKELLSTKEKKDGFDITLIQSLSNSSKFNIFLEKATEIGIDRVVPIESEYSLIQFNKAIKEYGLWKKIISDAMEQSRNIKPTVIEKPIKLNDLDIESDSNMICLATENIKRVSLNEYIKSVNIEKPFIIAIGPERGWSSNDINIFKKLGFKFVTLEGNILRTETVGLVIGSIIKYLKGEI